MSGPTEFFGQNARKTSFRGEPSFAKYLKETGLFNSEEDVIENIDVLANDMRVWLASKGYEQAQVLMDYMLELNEGKTREDGVTPSALHELTQALWFITATEDGIHVDDPEGVLSVIFAHDLGEDYGLTPENMEKHLYKNGIRPSEKVKQFKEDFDAISKKYGKDGEPKYDKDYPYYLDVQANKNASVAKMFDRSHNIMTLVGVKDKNKMHDYIAKTLQLQNDYVKNACENFPSQTELYETMQRLIETEIQISRYYTVDTGKTLPDKLDIAPNMPEKGFKDLPRGFQPLIIPADRIRQTYPETHYRENQDYDADHRDNQADMNSDGDKNEPVS